MVTQASIYIRRERAFVASVVRLKVILDDEIVAEVANGSYVELLVLPGRHILRLKFANNKKEKGLSSPVELDCQPGEHYDFVCRATTAAAPKIWKERRSAKSPKATKQTPQLPIRFDGSLGTATGIDASEIISNTQASIYIRRERAFVASVVRLKVILDDEIVAEVANGSYVELLVLPGRHILRLKFANNKKEKGLSSPVELDCQPGEHYDFVCRATTAAAPKIWKERRSAKSPKENSLGSRSLTSTTNARATAAGGHFYSYAILERSRSSRAIGNDVIEIDNENGVADVERELTLAKEWVREFTLAREDSRTNQLSVSLGPAWLAVKGDIENCLTERYSIRAQETRRFEEKMTVRVPAGSRLQVHLDWKILLQHGLVVATDNSSEIASVPFTVTVGLTFDQRQAKL